MTPNNSKVIENRQLAFSFSPDGLAMALMSFNDQHHPHIIACEFISYASSGNMQKSLQSLIERHQLQGMSCLWILEAEQYRLKLIDELQVPEAELTQAAKWVIKDKLNYTVDDASVDVFKIPSFGAGHHRKKMYVVAAQSSQLQKTLDIIYQQGLDLTVIDIYALALSYLPQYVLPEKKYNQTKTIILVTMEVPYSQIIIIHNNSIYLVRHLTLNLSALTGSPAEQQVLHQTMLLELNRSYHYCKSELALHSPDLLLLTPHFATQPKLVQLLTDKIDSEVAVMDLNHLTNQDNALTTEQQIRCLAVIGGILRSGAQHAAD